MCGLGLSGVGCLDRLSKCPWKGFETQLSSFYRPKQPPSLLLASSDVQSSVFLWISRGSLIQPLLTDESVAQRGEVIILMSQQLDPGSFQGSVKVPRPFLCVRHWRWGRGEGYWHISLHRLPLPPASGKVNSFLPRRLSTRTPLTPPVKSLGDCQASRAVA